MCERVTIKRFKKKVQKVVNTIKFANYSGMEINLKNFFKGSTLFFYLTPILNVYKKL